MLEYANSVDRAAPLIPKSKKAGEINNILPRMLTPPPTNQKIKIQLCLLCKYIEGI